MNRGSTPARQQGVPALTGLRFFAASAIVFWHLQGFLFVNSAFWPFQLDSAVQLFFILSGFVLTISYNDKKDYRHFMISRFARLWPSHLAAFLFVIVLFWAFDSVHWIIDHPDETGLNLLLLQSWFPQPRITFSFDGPAWSLSDEMFFYALYPICIAILARRPLLTSALAFAATTLGVFLIAKWFPGVSTGWLGYISPPVNLCVFATGVALGVLWRRMPPAEISFFRSTVFEVAVLVVALCANALFRVLFFSDMSGIGRFLLTAGAVPAYGALIFVLARYRGAVGRFLSWQPIVFLGETSFALYLVHQPLLRWYGVHVVTLGTFSFWWKLAGIWIVALSLAFLLHLLVELPFRSMIMARWNARTRSAPAARSPARGQSGAGPDIARSGHRAIILCSVAGIGFVALSVYPVHVSAAFRHYVDARHFLRRIDASLSEPTEIFRYPPAGEFRTVADYGSGRFRHLRFYRRADAVRLSGMSHGSSADGWDARIDRLPIPQLVTELEAAGVRGFLIDRAALPRDRYAAVRDRLTSLTGRPAAEDRSRGLAFWPLPDPGYTLEYRADRTKIDRIIVTDRAALALHPITRFVRRDALMAALAPGSAEPRTIDKASHPEVFADTDMMDMGLGATPVDPIAAFKGGLTCDDRPSRPLSLARDTVTLTIHNQSAFDWNMNDGQFPILIGVKELLRPDGSVLRWDGGFRVAESPLWVPSGSDMKIAIPLAAVDRKLGIPRPVFGTIAVFGFVQDGVAWFGTGECRIGLGP